MHRLIRNWKLFWGSGSNDYSAKFTQRGLALQNVQFAFRNVVGEGSLTKRGAVWNWVKASWHYLTA